jgi:hypothetical protein
MRIIIFILISFIGFQLLIPENLSSLFNESEQEISFSSLEVIERIKLTMIKFAPVGTLIDDLSASQKLLQFQYNSEHGQIDNYLNLYSQIHSTLSPPFKSI